MPLSQEASSDALSEEDFLASLDASPAPKIKGRTEQEFLDFVGQLYPPQEKPGIGTQIASGAAGALGYIAEAPALGAKMVGLEPPEAATEGALAMKGAEEALFPEATREGGIGEVVTRGLGYMAPGMIAAGGAAALGGPIAGAAMMGAAGAAATAPEMYWSVFDATGDEGKAMQAGLAGFGLGALEAAGLGPLATRLDKASGGAVKKLMLNVLQEAGQEAVQAGLQAEVFEQLTGEDVEIWSEMARGAEGGAAIAATFMALTGVPLATARRLLRGKVSAKPEPHAVQGEPASASSLAHETEAPAALATQAAPVAPGEGLAPEAQQVVQPVEPPLAQPARASEQAPLRLGEQSSPSPEAVQEPAAAPEAGAAESEPEPLRAELDKAMAAPEVAPPEPAPEADKATGIKNRTVEKELEQIGLPLPEKEDRRGFVEIHAEAKETFEKDQASGSRLVDELEAEPRPPTDKEDALLAFEANRLINEREAAEEAFIKNPSEINQKRIDAAKEAYRRTADVLDRVGTESGRSLNARKMMLARDYSLAAMERSLEVAKGGEPLTEQETARVKELHGKLDAATKAHEAYVTAAELKKAELEAENAMLKLKKEASKPSKRQARAASIEKTKSELDEILNKLAAKSQKAAAGLGGLDVETLKLTVQAAVKGLKLGVQTFAQWADGMVGRLGEGIRPYLQTAWEQAHAERRGELAAPLKEKIAGGAAIEDLGSDIQKIAEGFVSEGVSDTETLAKKVHEVLKESDPNISLRETRDAISGYGKFKQLSKSEIKRKMRDLKGEMRELSKLEDVTAGQKPAKTGFEQRKPTRKEQRLSDKTKALAKKLGIEVRKLSIRIKVGTSTEEQVAAKQAMAKIQSRRTRLQNEIRTLEEKIKAGDFAPKPKAAPIQDPEAIRLLAEKEKTKRIFEREKEKQRRAQRTIKDKAVDAAKEVLDLPRALLSAFDFSAVRRQGGFFTSGHILRSAPQIKEMFRAWANPQAALEIDTAIRSRPGAKLAEAAGLELTSADESLGPMEEALRSRLSDRIPGIAASNRAYVTYLNLQRSSAFDSMIEAHPGTPTLEEAKQIAQFVNIATGRASGARAKKFAARLEGIKFFWAPSYVVSRFQLLFKALDIAIPGKRMSWSVRKAIGKEFARYAAGQAIYYGIIGTGLSLLADELDEEFDIEIDPRSSDFGKIRIGDTRYDPLSGLAQTATFLSRMATGKVKETTSKEIQNLNEGTGPYDPTYMGTILRFGRSKLGPLQSRFANALTGETYEGKEVTLAEALLEPPIPLTIDGTITAMRDLGVPSGVILGIMSLFGDGLQSFEPKEKKPKKKRRNL